MSCDDYFPYSNDKTALKNRSFDGECPFESSVINWNKDKVVLELDRVVPGAKALTSPRLDLLLLPP